MTDITQELDALIAKARQQFSEEDRALHLIASALQQSALARGVVISLGNQVAAMRQPVPIQAQPNPAINGAQQAVDDEWARQRAVQPPTFANGQWPQE